MLQSTPGRLHSGCRIHSRRTMYSWVLLFGLLTLTVVVNNGNGTLIFETRPSTFELFSGETASFTCVPIDRNAFVIWVIQPVHDPGVTVLPANSTNLTGADSVLLSLDRTRIMVTGVRKSLHNARIECRTIHNSMQVPAGDVLIHVKRPPNFEPAPGTVQAVEFQTSAILHLNNFDGGFPVATADVLYDGNNLSTSQFEVSQLSLSWTILIPGVLRSDSGLYTVRLINVYGAVSGNFTVDIIYPPEFSRGTAPQIDQFLIGSSFIFNCTESDANPSIVMYTFRKNGIVLEAGISVLIISSAVVRADTGNYSCTATNTAGSTTLYYYLLAVAPPTKPLSLSVHEVSAFSATLLWTAPSDDGGVSNPSWTPPPGSPNLLVYSVVYANSSGSWTTEAMTTQSTLRHLQHSTNYNVMVSAQNAYGKSAVALGHFRSRDTVPIIQEVVVVPAFRLTSIRVDITLLTNGGHDVTLLTIRFADIIEEDNSTFSGSFASLHFTGLNLAHGNSYSLFASASNSIGVSATASRVAYIPNRLMIPEPLSELPLSEITTCCAGFMINVQNPSVDIVDFALEVTANGVPSTSSQYTVLRNGLKVQLSGLQAGTRYLFDVTFGNAFGMHRQQIYLVSLLGKPSKPPVPQVSVSNTNVTVNVTTFYPGTQGVRDNSFLYFILRFTDQVAMAVKESRITVLSLHLMPAVPVSATYNTELNVGLYTLTVTAVNEHGSVRSDSTNNFFASDIIFKPAPSNSSVLKQGIASFTCRPESNSSENVFIIWIIQPVSAPGITVRKDNMSTLVGSTAVYMSPDRTQIFITGVQSSLDGASVECRGASVNQLSAGLVYIHLQYPPNITAPPTELSPSSHSPCCSAVELNLAEPGGVSSVGVSLSTGGGPFEVVDSGDVSLDGDLLYISGLQAGAVYVAIISISNLDATITTNVTLQPLIGIPHDPALPLVFINGTEVRVMLSTEWPGTSAMFNRSQFMFQLHFLAVHEVAPNVAIQNIYVNVTNYSAPVNVTHQSILQHGSYKVKVSAINEHGSSGEIESEKFSVLSRTDRPTDSSNHVQITVPAVAGVAGGALLLLLIFLGILIFCVAYRRYCMVKLNLSHDGSKEDYVYDEVEMRPVAANDVLCVQMQGNPSYKPLRSGSGITPGHISLPDTQPSQQLEEDSIDEGYIVTDSGQNDQPVEAGLPAIGEHIVLNDNPSYD